MMKKIRLMYSILQEISSKFICICVIIGLLLPNVKIMALEDLNLDKYKKENMDTFFNQAQKLKDDALWRAVVNSGYRIISSEWEKDANEKIDAKVEKAKTEEGLSDEGAAQIRAEYAEKLNLAKAEWENEAKKDIEIRHGKWILTNLDINWKEVDRKNLLDAIDQANKDYLYVTDDSGNIVIENGIKKVKPVIGSNYWNDFAQWETAVKSVMESDLGAYEENLKSDMTEAKKKAKSEYKLTGEEYDQFVAFIDQEEAQRKDNFIRERDFLFGRAKTEMIYDRLYDQQSMIRDSQSDSAESIATDLISDTELRLDKEAKDLIAILDSQSKEVATADLEDFNQIRKTIEDAFKSGIDKWRAAEEDFIAERIKWEKNASLAVKDGEKKWEA